MATFETAFYQQRREEQNPHTIGTAERYTGESILQREKICKWIEEDQPLDKLLSQEKDWWYYYHLSVMRQGLFAWYPFKKEAELLEIDAEYGALTGLFCDKCKKVAVTETCYERAKAIAKRYNDRENLTVYAGALEDFDYTKFYDRFDYIVINGVLERKGYGYKEQKAYLEYLNLIRKMLKPTGILLLVVNNRYGLQYFCGKREKFTGYPYEGINQYPDGTPAYGFEKGEVSSLLENSGFAHKKFYYPLPDADYPQAVATDESRDWDDFEERLTFYDRDPDTLVAREKCLMRDFMKNGALGYMANDFFVEASVNAAQTNIKEAFVAMDRGKARSFATAIENRHIVRKTPVFMEGEAVAAQCCQNIKELMNRGIHVVEHQMEKGSIMMPEVQAPTLSAVLREAAVNDKEYFFELFDLLYHEILKSSDIVENCLENEEYPILKKCYFDMTPVNCFVIDHKLVFFDQEFVKEEYSAKYVLYRAIKYTYMSMWELQELIPKEKLIRKYGLEKCLKKFEREEERFIGSIRNVRENYQLYCWSATDEFKIYHNAHRLATNIDEKKIRDIPLWVKQAQTVQLRLLEKMSEVCEKYGLKYYAFFGTLLGAVRHGGFVPWDDDTDVLMFRSDYDKLLAVAEEEFGEDFFLQTMQSDDQGFYGGYSRLRYVKSTAIEIYHWNTQKKQGIWMDIMPLDDMPGPDKVEKVWKEISEIQKIMFAKVYNEEETFRGMDPEEFSRYKKIAETYKYEELCDKLNEKCKGALPSDEVTIMTRYQPWGKYIGFKRDFFGEGKIVPFEGDHIRIPDRADILLQWFYGEHYMDIPDKPEQVFKHEILCRPNEKYELYLRRLVNYVDKSTEKSYIIMGTSDLAATFIGKYQNDIKIIGVVDEGYLEQQFWGYPVLSYEELQSISAEQRQIIICDRYFGKIEKCLRQHEICDYQIYVYNPWWLLENNE